MFHTFLRNIMNILIFLSKSARKKIKDREPRFGIVSVPAGHAIAGGADPAVTIQRRADGEQDLGFSRLGHGPIRGGGRVISSGNRTTVPFSNRALENYLFYFSFFFPPLGINPGVLKSTV